jgi:hypothetical protein
LTKQAWPSAVSLSIDDDIDDATIAAGSYAKAYTFACTAVMNPEWSDSNTNPTAINSVNNASFSFINGNGQVGQIIGYGGYSLGFYYSASNNAFGNALWAPDTFMYGLNNLGYTTGATPSGSDTWDGVIDYGENVIAPVDFAGAISTVPTAINDDNMVSGLYEDSSNDYHPFYFSLQNYTYYTIPDYPGAISTYATGINGTGQIVGYYSLGQTASEPCAGGCFGFFYDTATGNLSSVPCGVPYGIKNNGQIVGALLDGDGLQGDPFFYDMNTGTCAQMGINIAALGINDFTQIAGLAYWNGYQPPLDNAYGFYALPSSSPNCTSVPAGRAAFGRRTPVLSSRGARNPVAWPKPAPR